VEVSLLIEGTYCEEDDASIEDFKFIVKGHVLENDGEKVVLALEKNKYTKLLVLPQITETEPKWKLPKGWTCIENKLF
jgi:hypothetical protein